MYGRNLQTSPQRFLEEVRLYPFLYDKTQPNYKDKEEKMNRWELIGALFGLTTKSFQGPTKTLNGSEKVHGHFLPPSFGCAP
ncbi:hypothetical protein HPB52_004495 [Rhipicephalus sanguineus]|uniref:MADF domain-containing protein n=1 Tax=Rhipicephalus sanguineus TaxID=34632 RepID=A0A9D4QB12_RHISA|nr:hypothetical protein HPB52_004495 [Rhipicephalus sanguineus]